MTRNQPSPILKAHNSHSKTKLFSKFISSVLCLALVFAVFNKLVISVSGEAGSPSENLAGFQEIDSNKDFTLYAKIENGEIAVYNKTTDELWHSNPVNRENDDVAKTFYKEALSSQIIITYVDVYTIKVNVSSEKGSVQAGGLSSKIEKNSVRFTYDFPKEKIIVPVRYSLTEKGFAAEIISDEIKEYGTDYQLVSVELLPYFGASERDVYDGYMFVPDGAGALINLDNGKSNADTYTSPVYGIDEAGGMKVSTNADKVVTSYNESIRIPVFGMKRGETGFVGIITDSAPRAKIKAMVSGNGTAYNQVSSIYDFKSLTNVQLLQREFSGRIVSIVEKLNGGMKGHKYRVDYYFTEKDKTGYSDMAQIYRNYLLDNDLLSKKKLPDETPFIADLYGYVVKKKSFFGIPKDTIVKLTTFEDATKIADELAARDIKGITIRFTNWANDGAYEKLPLNSVPSSKLGGSKGLSKLKSALNEIDGELYLNTELLNVYKTGNGISRFNDVLQSASNTPLVYNQLKLDSGVNNTDIKSWYLLRPTNFKSVFNRFINKYLKLGISNVSLSSIGSKAYSEGRSNGTGRDEVPDLISDALSEITSKVNNLMLEQANDFAAVQASIIINTESRSSGYDVIDEDVPFYQIVFHGYIDYTHSSINLASSPETAVLKCIETGAAPMFSWVGRNFDELQESRLNNLFSADYTKWMEDAGKAYSNIKSVGDKVRGETIVSHEKLADLVYKTTYSNGVYSIVNYGKESVTIDGEKIEAQNFISNMEVA